MEKIGYLKRKRILLAILSVFLLALAIAFAIVSFKLVGESKYSVMWYFLVGSAISLYSATATALMFVNNNLYIRVVSAVISESSEDEGVLEGVLWIKAKSLKKIIKKCKKRGYIA